MNTSAERLWKMAEDYFLVAGENLFKSQPSALDQEAFTNFVDTTILHFLFPGLNDAERNYLLALLQMRRAVQLGVGILGNPEAHLEDREGFERRLAHDVQQFTAMKESGCPCLREKLTPVQLEILEQKYERIEFRQSE